MPIGRVSELSEVPSISDFLKRNGMSMKGMRKATKTVMENGYPKDQWKVTFKEGVYATAIGPDFLFEDGERDRIIDDLKGTELPQIIPFTDDRMSINAPHEIKNVSTDNRSWKNIDWSKDDVLCPLFNENGEMIMIEQRYRDDQGMKQCIRWSYHDDHKWRFNDPDKLPLWGLDQMKDGPNTVFIHEGPKAAAAGRRFYENSVLGHKERKEISQHPWFGELSKYPHLGWIGGTGRPDESHWKRLKSLGVERVIVFPDNDDNGRKAAYGIAGELLGVDVFTLPKYPDGTKVGWDLADGIDLLGDGWQGMPRLVDITQMWSLTGGKTPKPYALPEYPKGIAYLADVDEFTYFDRPRARIKTGQIGRVFGRNLHPALVENYAKHVATRQDVIYDGRTFEPEAGPIIDKDDETRLNIWQPTKVKEVKMDAEGAKLWEWYLEQLAPDPVERALLKRWIATTIAHPARKYFGVLLHSTEQGTGKSTLFDSVFEPIIGDDQCFSPTVKDIQNFTSWREGKIVIYADEIAAKGKNASEIYNDLKTFVTSPKARVEKKGVDVVMMPDYSKILINSNMDVPLYFEVSDRRWLVIHGSERKMMFSESSRLRSWLAGDGCGMVLYWARRIAEDRGADIDPSKLDQGFQDTFELSSEASYIPNGANAPLTESKLEMREKATPIHHKMVKEILDDLDGSSAGDQKPLALPSVVVERQVMDMMEAKNRPINQDVVLRRLAAAGWYTAEVSQRRENLPNPIRRRINGMDNKAQRFTIIMNEPAMAILKDKGVVSIKSSTSLKYEPKQYKGADGKLINDFNRVIRALGDSYRQLGIIMDETAGRWKTSDTPDS